MVHELFDDSAEGAIVLRLHVQPGAGRTSVLGVHGDALKVRVAAPPEQGWANEACVKLLVDLLGVKAPSVELVSGGTTRAKRFRITGADADDVGRRLGLALDEAGGNARGRGSVPKPGSR